MSDLAALVQNNVASVKRMEAIAPVLCDWFDHEFLELWEQAARAFAGNHPSRW